VGPWSCCQRILTWTDFAFCLSDHPATCCRGLNRGACFCPAQYFTLGAIACASIVSLHVMSYGRRLEALLLQREAFEKATQQRRKEVVLGAAMAFQQGVRL
jgi:hypothetical protein